MNESALTADAALRYLSAHTGETVLAVTPDRMNMQAREPARSAGAVAIVPLHGTMTPRGLSFFGRQITPGMNNFRAALAGAVSNPDVAAIVLDVDSPGGTVAGTAETAAAVKAASQVKPVIAVVDTLAASAAYWVASQASQIVVTPSGEVGSIGVLAIHQEASKMMEEIGYTTTIIRSRPGKADANPYEPLTPEAKAAIEASVMEADGEFIKAVASGRGVTPATVRANFGEGRLVNAKTALAAGMVDRIATMSEVLSGMVKPRAPARRRSAFAFID